MLGIEYCHLQVCGKTLGIIVKERKCNDHIYPVEVHRDLFHFHLFFLDASTSSHNFMISILWIYI